jgi:hypothetical protein
MVPGGRAAAADTALLLVWLDVFYKNVGFKHLKLILLHHSSSELLLSNGH